MKKIKIRFDDGQIDMEEVEKFAEKLNKRLPDCYKKFITQHNTAYLIHNYFDFLNTFIHKEDSRDTNFLGYGNNVSESELIDNSQEHDIYNPYNIIPFAQSANGDYICFDYRQDPETDNPPIVVMYHDAYDDDEKMYVDFVAKDFETFMDSLYGYDEDDNKIYPED